MEQFFQCPYCGETISFVIDTSEPAQTYIEDCEVCCRPIQVTYQATDGELESFEANRV